MSEETAAATSYGIELIEEHVPAEVIADIEELHDRIFARPRRLGLAREMNTRPRQLLVLARASANGSVLGFKLGYEHRVHTYYSWLGGVDPDHRRRGIARRLMARQHDWCVAQGYATVRTKTRNEFRPMLILNLMCGFQIIGLLSRPDAPRIVMEKTLRPLRPLPDPGSGEDPRLPGRTPPL